LQQEDFRAIRRDFRALGQLLKVSESQVVFSSALPFAGNDEGRNRKTQEINTCLRAWCHWQNFGVFDRGLVYMTLSLLPTDSIQLSRMTGKMS